MGHKKIIKEILDILNTHFPHSTGAILTGSYLTKNYSSSLSDIDIVVFDSIFSTISTLGFFHNGGRIDFTLVPLNDIDNVLRNEQFDQRGILLTMLSKGKIIKDNRNSIVHKIKKKAEILFNNGIHDNLDTYKALLKGLSKIRKDFFKNPKDYQRIFLVNDFFYYVTQIELIKTANWRMSGKHKADYLYEQNNLFSEKLIRLFSKNSIEQGYENFHEIGFFIDNYLSVSVNIESSRHFNEKYLILDLDYENLQIEHFVQVFLNKIETSILLSKCYSYFYMSHGNMPRIYKNKLSVCFNVLHLETEAQKKILKEVDSVFKNELNIKYRCQTTPSYEINEINENNSFIGDFEHCSKQVSLLMKNLILTYGKYDVKRNIIISLILNSFLATYLKIEDEDLHLILNYLSVRHMMSKNEQSHKNSTQIHDFKKVKLDRLRQFFKPDERIFIEATEKGKAIVFKNELFEGKIYQMVIQELISFLRKHNKINNAIIETNLITVEILKTFIKNSEVGNCLTFVLIFDYLQPLLLLNSDQTTLLLIIFCETINHSNKIKSTSE